MTAPTSEHAPPGKDKSILMIAWRPECYRSSVTAELFDADLELIWPETASGKFGRALRYFLSFRRTFQLVRTRSPNLAIVMNLPAFAPLAAQLAAFSTGTKIVLDFHSGGITSKFWNKFGPIYRYISRRAPFTICHNRFDASVVDKWGGTPFLLTALPRDFEGIDYQKAPAEPAILVICSFKSDEPIDILLAAMRQCPGVHFEMTGNYRKAGLKPAAMPANVTLLGFVPYEEYVHKMARSTAILTVSDRGHIMQAAVHEALSLGVPVITNISPTIESVLGDAGVYATVEPDTLAGAIQTAVASADRLRERMIARKNVIRSDLRRLADGLPRQSTFSR